MKLISEDNALDQQAVAFTAAAAAGTWAFVKGESANSTDERKISVKQKN